MRSFYLTGMVHVSVLAVVLFSLPAYAHRLVPNDGTHVDADTAIPIADVSVSQVAYHEVTETAPRIWLTFDGTAGQDVYMQIGVPVLDRLEDYRPSLALIGPGLPTADLPFAVPEGMGALVLPTNDVTPEYFYEPVTGTESWILLEDEVPLPDSGQYFVVGFDPAGETGKLWVAVGRTEAFGLRDVLTLPRVIHEVRAFHEAEGPSVTIIVYYAVILGLSLLLGFVVGLL